MSCRTSSGGRWNDWGLVSILLKFYSCNLPLISSHHTNLHLLNVKLRVDIPIDCENELTKFTRKYAGQGLLDDPLGKSAVPMHLPLHQFASS